MAELKDIVYDKCIVPCKSVDTSSVSSLSVTDTSFYDPVVHSSSCSFELSEQVAERQNGRRSKSDTLIRSGARPDDKGTQTEHIAAQTRF
jgi:hypothetical protein